MDGLETARRVREAWAYSMLSQKELADRAGLHRDRVRALIGRTTPKRASVEEMWAIADASGVPRDFMERGFRYGAEDLELAAAERTELAERIRHEGAARVGVDQGARDRLAQIEAELRELREATGVVRRGGGGVPPGPPGELGRRIGERQPTRERTPTEQTPAEGDPDAVSG